MDHIITLKTDKLTFQYFDSVDQCQAWDEIAGDQVYLSSDYLQLVERNIEGLTAQYHLVLEGGKAIGIIYFQEYPFHALKSFNSFETKNTAGTMGFLRRAISGLLSFNGLANGHMMLTGPYGFKFLDEVPVEKQLQIVDDTFKIAITQAKKKKRISLHFLKELTVGQDQVHGGNFEQKGFYRFTVQPTMHFHVDPAWENMNDYLGAIKSKYRVRYRKACDRGSKLKRLLLTADEIAEQQSEIFDLYTQVIGESAFNLMEVSPKYFEDLSATFRNRFTMKAYYLEGKLVGFMSFIDANDVLEAHFTGIDQEVNRDCDLYLNMLYDLVEEAIVGRKKYLNLSRTALEIKSSVGAVPADMYCYLRHRSSLLNRLLPKIFQFLYKQEPWQQRIPFKS